MYRRVYVQCIRILYILYVAGRGLCCPVLNRFETRSNISCFGADRKNTSKIRNDGVRGTRRMRTAVAVSDQGKVRHPVRFFVSFFFFTHSVQVFRRDSKIGCPRPFR